MGGGEAEEEVAVEGEEKEREPERGGEEGGRPGRGCSGGGAAAGRLGWFSAEMARRGGGTEEEAEK